MEDLCHIYAVAHLATGPVAPKGALPARLPLDDTGGVQLRSAEAKGDRDRLEKELREHKVRVEGCDGRPVVISQGADGHV